MAEFPMRSLGYSLLSGLVLLTVVWLFADATSSAAPETTGTIAIASAAAAPLPSKTASEPIVRRVARKGTRNYPDDGEALTVPTTTPTGDAAADHDALKECMDIWDAATHITKSKWREICARQIKERGDARRAFETETPTTP